MMRCNAGYEGMYDRSEIKGSFNAINASKRAFEVSSEDSQVQRVQSYLDAIRDLSELKGDAVTDQELDDAVEKAAEKAAVASSQPVTEAMLDEVNRISNEKGLTNPPSNIDLGNDRTDEVAKEAREIQDGS